MRLFGVLLILAALAALAVFVWPLLRPQVAEGPRPETFHPERSLGVAAAQHAAAGAATALPVPAEPPAGGAPPVAADGAPAAPAVPAAPAEPSEPDGPLCDRAADADVAPVLAAPRGTWLRRASTPCRDAWTWVNLWAAWCKPCKEEMPLLAAWARERNRDGCRVRLLFLSVDDDERELRRYLDGPGRDLDAEVLWLPDEAARSALYRALEVDDPPTLPVQAVLDPTARRRCVRVGSIGAAELETARQTFGW